MTEKRFTLIDMNNIEWKLISPIKDNGRDVTVKQVVELLNAQHEEIQKLKAQLYCTTDGVCDICNNEYLVPQGNYYISKCKKGHDECSKMDLDYCDDFELKNNGDVE